MSYDSDYGALTRRLGWVSAYSRKVLLGRHFLRCLGPIGQTRSLGSQDDKQWFLELLRALFYSQQIGGDGHAAISSPCYPSNRPTTFSLAMHSKQIIGTIVTDRTPPATLINDYRKKTEALLSKALIEDIELADQLLLHEIQLTTKRTNLSTKSVVDDRCRQLLKTPLWQGSNSSPFQYEVEQLFHELVLEGFVAQIAS